MSKTRKERETSILYEQSLDIVRNRKKIQTAYIPTIAARITP